LQKEQKYCTRERINFGETDIEVLKIPLDTDSQYQPVSKISPEEMEKTEEEEEEEEEAAVSKLCEKKTD
jgi:hypothetical protein